MKKKEINELNNILYINKYLLKNSVHNIEQAYIIFSNDIIKKIKRDEFKGDNDSKKIILQYNILNGLWYYFIIIELKDLNYKIKHKTEKFLYGEEININDIPIPHKYTEFEYYLSLLKNGGRISNPKFKEIFINWIKAKAFNCKMLKLYNIKNFPSDTQLAYFGRIKNLQDISDKGYKYFKRFQNLKVDNLIDGIKNFNIDLEKEKYQKIEVINFNEKTIKRNIQLERKIGKYKKYFEKFKIFYKEHKSEFGKGISCYFEFQKIHPFLKGYEWIKFYDNFKKQGYRLKN